MLALIVYALAGLAIGWLLRETDEASAREPWHFYAFLGVIWPGIVLALWWTGRDDA